MSWLTGRLKIACAIMKLMSNSIDTSKDNRRVLVAVNKLISQQFVMMGHGEIGSALRFPKIDKRALSMHALVIITLRYSQLHRAEIKEEADVEGSQTFPLLHSMMLKNRSDI